MKMLYQFRYEWSLLFLLGILAGLVYLFPVEGNGAFLWGAGLTLCLALILLVLWRLYQIKWKRAIALGIQKVFSAISRRFSLWMEQRSIRNKRNILLGETNIRFHFEESEKTKKKAKKQPRWRQLKTERQKMKYLYRQTVSARIRRGTRIYASHTPEEIQTMDENSAVESEVFSLYTKYRYDERTEPPEGSAEKIKNEK